MIYSRFGTPLALLSKEQAGEGGATVRVQATAQGAADVRDYQLTELTADGGLTEIQEALKTLPLKVLQKATRVR